MREYGYKDVCKDYSHLSMKELDEAIKKEKAKCEKLKSLEDLQKIENGKFNYL